MVVERLSILSMMSPFRVSRFWSGVGRCEGTRRLVVPEGGSGIVDRVLRASVDTLFHALYLDTARVAKRGVECAGSSRVTAHHAFIGCFLCGATFSSHERHRLINRHVESI